ncbi:HEAT repeat domain-containing protein [Streptomyces sp. NPDC087212]|uniref:HEAT repeat domain-containing protein n=1 Tax=Streptomyces sp. NPDC087212 TaxID=3365766 RepID=UPI0037F31FFD
MFTGIDEVDWASMRHAYGSAEDVPALLRGLASADSAAREVALDGMYGAVHHQGDVYDSTLACLPFLFRLVQCEEVGDRGEVVGLLVSIGGEAVEGGAVGEGPEETYARARTAVRAGAAAFARLAGDPDPAVRQAAPGAVVRFLDQPARVLDLLAQRISVERNDGVLIALAESLGLFARRHPGHAPRAVDLLAALSGPPAGPGLRLAALGQLAGCAPERLPVDLVSTAVALLRVRSRGPRPHPRAATDTLVGRLRQLRPSDEEGSQLLRTLHGGLGDRVADRIALLEGQLSSPDPTDRCNAVWMASALVHGWRGDFHRPVELIGAQLAEGEGRLRDSAVSVLSGLFGLAAPAAEQLSALVDAHGDLWVRHWERGAPTLGDPLKALARAGDARAVPVLALVLAGPVVPDDLGHVIAPLGRAAAPLAPALRSRLAGVPLDSPELGTRALPLLAALTALEDVRAVPAVLRVLLGAPEEVRSRDALIAAAIRALRAFGAAAAEAAPVLRTLLDTEYAVAAADALWSVQGDADAVRPVLARELANGRSGVRRPAAEALARMGPAARPALPALRHAADSPELWERMSAACALWRVGGEEGLAVPVLRAAWAENPHCRLLIADCLVALGPAGAPLHDLVDGELAAPRRHTASFPGVAGPGGHSEQGAFADEQLLRLLRMCRGARE